MGHKMLPFFLSKYDVLINYFLKLKYFPQTSNSKIFLNRLFDIVQHTDIQDQKKCKIIGDVKIKVKTRTYDFSLKKKISSRNGVKIQLQENLLVNGRNFQEF